MEFCLWSGPLELPEVEAESEVSYSHNNVQLVWAASEKGQNIGQGSSVRLRVIPREGHCHVLWAGGPPGSWENEHLSSEQGNLVVPQHPLGPWCFAALEGYGRT